jgi:hypothetical protein
MGKARWNEMLWRHPTPECWPRSSGRQSHPTVISPSNNHCLTLNEPRAAKCNRHGRQRPTPITRNWRDLNGMCREGIT